MENENVFKNEDGSYKDIVLKKAKISKTKATKEILGVTVEYVFKGGIRKRELFLNVLHIIEFIRTSNNDCRDFLAFMNRDIHDAIYETIQKTEGVKKWIKKIYLL